MEEEAKNKKSSTGCIIAIVFIIIAIIISVCVAKLISDISSNSDSVSGIESITYRNIEKSDYSVSYELTGLTRLVFTIQANTNIEEFNATISIFDENKNVIDSQTVKYEKMTSGTRYEVVFNLSLSESYNASSMSISNVSGKVKK